MKFNRQKKRESVKGTKKNHIGLIPQPYGNTVLSVNALLSNNNVKIDN